MDVNLKTLLQVLVVIEFVKRFLETANIAREVPILHPIFPMLAFMNIFGLVFAEEFPMIGQVDVSIEFVPTVETFKWFPEGA